MPHRKPIPPQSIDRQVIPMFDYPLQRRTRIILLLLIVPMLLSYWVPLWSIHLKAPQYPNGLQVNIYSYRIAGGHGGQDLNEINERNHYIGMRKLDRSEFTDLDWIPFAFRHSRAAHFQASANGRFTWID